MQLITRIQRGQMTVWRVILPSSLTENPGHLGPRLSPEYLSGRIWESWTHTFPLTLWASKNTSVNIYEGNFAKFSANYAITDFYWVGIGKVKFRAW